MKFETRNSEEYQISSFKFIRIKILKMQIAESLFFTIKH